MLYCLFNKLTKKLTLHSFLHCSQQQQRDNLASNIGVTVYQTNSFTFTGFSTTIIKKFHE